MQSRGYAVLPHTCVAGAGPRREGTPGEGDAEWVRELELLLQGPCRGRWVVRVSVPY